MIKCLTIRSLFLLILMSMRQESYGISGQNDEQLLLQSPTLLIQTLPPEELEFLLTQQKILDQIMFPSRTNKDCGGCNSQTIDQNATAQPNKYGNGLFVFVSLSMTDANIIQLANEAKRYAAILVLRGLKNGSFSETVRALKPIIEKSQNGLIIDPTLFKHYNVTQVPTFVFSTEGKEPDRVAGNISLTYALELIAKQGAQQEEAAQLLKGKEHT